MHHTNCRTNCRTTLPHYTAAVLFPALAWHVHVVASLARGKPATWPPGLPPGLPRAHVAGLPRAATESVRTKSRGTLANACMCVCLAWVQEEDNRTLAESGVKKRGNPVVTVGLPVVLTSGFSFALLKFLNK